MKRYLLFLLTTAFAMTSPGCLSVRIDHEFDPAYDLADYRTFSLETLPYTEWDDTTNQVMGTDGLSKDVVKSILEEKGYKLVKPEEADLIIKVRVVQVNGSDKEEANDPKIEDAFSWVPEPPPHQTDPSYRAEIARNQHLHSTNKTNRPRGPKASNQIYLLIEVFDTRSGELAWKGWAVSNHARYFGSDKDKWKIVSKILNDFPN